MKRIRIVKTGGSIVVVFAIAAAASPLPAQAAKSGAIDPQALAPVDAMLDLCTKVNPSAAKRLPDYASTLAVRPTATQLRVVRESDEYKETYEAVSAQFAKFDAKDLAQACNGAAVAK